MRGMTRAVPTKAEARLQEVQKQMGKLSKETCRHAENLMSAKHSRLRNKSRICLRNELEVIDKYKSSSIATVRRRGNNRHTTNMLMIAVLMRIRSSHRAPLSKNRRLAR